MRWRKRGLVYAPSGELWWAQTHGFMPTACVLEDGRLRVFLASLDEGRFGRTGFVDLDASRPERVLGISPEPVLDLGELGAFDDCGATPSCAIRVGGSIFLYYIGWQRTERAPYQLFTGLAVSEDGGASFRRQSRIPVLDRTQEDPFSRSAPCVLQEDAGFRAWYWTCTHWSTEQGRVRYNTVIKHAESADGIRWSTSDLVCLAPEEPGDFAVGRPWVIKDRGMYRMWYSIRSSTARLPYRIGYAESVDGHRWTRMDAAAGIGPAASGWDSQMICFPCVVDVQGQRYMLYNGNHHGATGFGLAELVADEA